MHSNHQVTNTVMFFIFLSNYIACAVTKEERQIICVLINTLYHNLNSGHVLARYICHFMTSTRFPLECIYHYIYLL